MAFNFKKWILYFFAIPMLIILKIGIQYLINGYNTTKGLFKYDFMFESDAIPIPWYMKTKEFYTEYCIWYGVILCLLVLVYVFIVAYNKKRAQIILGILAVGITFYEFNKYIHSLP